MDIKELIIKKNNGCCWEHFLSLNDCTEKDGKKHIIKTRKYIEKLAELEHNQWVEWSKSISKQENISIDRLIRWRELWKPYKELSEEEKEQDRIYARKVYLVNF